MNPNIVATFGRLYPFFSGNFSLVNYSKFSRLFPIADSLAWCSSPGGPMLVPLNDAVGRCIYFTGDYDRKITWLCRKLLKPGDTALDIGANLGVVSLAMARFVGPPGQVHSFEPNPRMQELLSQSIKRSYRNIRLHGVALGSITSEMNLHVPAFNVGQGSLINRPEDSDVVKCSVRRLDDVIDDFRIDRVRLVKIDVEGFEEEVLKGAPNLLSRQRPNLILETNEQLDRPFREYPSIAALIKHDYWFFAIPRSLLSMKVFDVNTDRIGAPSHDVLAFPSERYAELKKLVG